MEELYYHGVVGGGGAAPAPAGDADLGDVLTGKTFESATAGAGATGTMPDRGAVSITPGGAAQAIAEGYHNGLGSVDGDADLQAVNIKNGVTLFGVPGSLIGLEKNLIYYLGIEVVEWEEGPSTRTGSVSKETGYLQMYASESLSSEGADRTFVTKDTYDLTSVNTLRFFINTPVANTANKRLVFSVHSNKTSNPFYTATDARTIVTSGQLTVIDLDVSSLSGDKYIMVGVSQYLAAGNHTLRVAGVQVI
jgi:hypothetical protein